MKEFVLMLVVIVGFLVIRKYIGVFIITSDSMYPTISAGDIVVTTRRHSYRVGDIITFHSQNSQHITHRVIQQSGSSHITKGDSNKQADSFIVFREQIDGVVISILHTSIFFSKGRIR